MFKTCPALYITHCSSGSAALGVVYSKTFALLLWILRTKFLLDGQSDRQADKLSLAFVIRALVHVGELVGLKRADDVWSALTQIKKELLMPRQALGVKSNIDSC